MEDKKKTTEQDIDAVLALLENCMQNGDSRVKINVTEDAEVKRQYHHGRCDVGSPWACGTPFDVVEEE